MCHRCKKPKWDLNKKSNQETDRNSLSNWFQSWSKITPTLKGNIQLQQIHTCSKWPLKTYNKLVDCWMCSKLTKNTLTSFWTLFLILNNFSIFILIHSFRWFPKYFSAGILRVGVPARTKSFPYLNHSCLIKCRI